MVLHVASPSRQLPPCASTHVATTLRPSPPSPSPSLPACPTLALYVRLLSAEHSHLHRHRSFHSPRLFLPSVSLQVGRSVTFSPKNFPSHPPSPYLSSPSEVGPLIELWGLGSAVSSPSGVRGRAPAAHAFLRNFSSKDGLLNVGIYSTPTLESGGGARTRCTPNYACGNMPLTYPPSLPFP